MADIEATAENGGYRAFDDFGGWRPDGCWGLLHTNTFSSLGGGTVNQQTIPERAVMGLTAHRCLGSQTLCHQAVDHSASYSQMSGIPDSLMF
ncbi:hypothetical protein GCM10017710_42500 [Arthrobacter ramosus]